MLDKHNPLVLSPRHGTLSSVMRIYRLDPSQMAAVQYRDCSGKRKGDYLESLRSWNEESYLAPHVFMRASEPGEEEAGEWIVKCHIDSRLAWHTLHRVSNMSMLDMLCCHPVFPSEPWHAQVTPLTFACILVRFAPESAGYAANKRHIDAVCGSVCSERLREVLSSRSGPSMPLKVLRVRRYREMMF